MKSTSIGLGLCLFALALGWIGCGGSESSPVDQEKSDSGADTGTSTLPGSDGGDGNDSSTVDAGDDGAIDAPEVDIQFGNCKAFTACGGDEKGTWKVSGGCVDDSVLDDAKSACSGLTVSNEKITAKGIVTADGTTLTRRTEAKLSASISIPPGCTQGKDCNLVAAFVKGSTGFDTVTCKAGASVDVCDCDVATTIAQNASATYTKAGNTLKTSGAEFDYCVDGSKLTFVQTSPSDAYPVTYELGK